MANGPDAVFWIVEVILEEWTCFRLSKMFEWGDAKVFYYWAMLILCCGPLSLSCKSAKLM